MTTAAPAHELLVTSPYQAYAYSYPHKTAYRPLQPARALAPLWRCEDRSSLFLYVHIPFCEMRCGFCNLFTLVDHRQALFADYLHALRRQAMQVADCLGDLTVARLAVGGGTPTVLSVDQLGDLFDTLQQSMGTQPARVPTSVEISPATTTREKLDLLRDRGVDRISIGVQSFDDHEARKLGRPQHRAEVDRALQAVRDVGFTTLNIDLMYGGADQTLDSWQGSIETAIRWRAEEIYLYPLYVRPLTGLARGRGQWDDHRLQSYRAGRDLLLDSGYEQVSMRMFRRADAPQAQGPVYCCQEDGMIGLGCGARSYTRALHYATEYAVGRAGVRELIEAYIDRTDDDFRVADFGCELDTGEQRRRYIIKSLLRTEGMDGQAYRTRFGADARAHYSQLDQLIECGLAAAADSNIRLTATGMERSDAIGPWLYSPAMRNLTDRYEWR